MVVDTRERAKQLRKSGPIGRMDGGGGGVTGSAQEGTGNEIGEGTAYRSIMERSGGQHGYTQQQSWPPRFFQGRGRNRRGGTRTESHGSGSQPAYGKGEAGAHRVQLLADPLHLQEPDRLRPQSEE